jgi:C4-dicarboxylate-specific signal transduction histidine kinase
VTISQKERISASSVAAFPTASATDLEALERIAPALAHDLRGPINTMNFQLELLGDALGARLASDPTAERPLRYASGLRSELARLHRGLEALFAQLARGSNDVWDATETVADLALLLEAAAKKGRIALVVDLPDLPLSATGDRVTFRRVTLGLALEILDRLEPGGTLEIHLVATQQGAPQLELAGSAPLAPQIGPRLTAARARLAAAGFDLARLGTEERPRIVLTRATAGSES